MDYTVTIKFKKKNEVTPKNINKVIELIPVAYKLGHTQKNMMEFMYPSSSYVISFRENQEAAENFRLSLFKRYGNIFDIKCNYI